MPLQSLHTSSAGVGVEAAPPHPPAGKEEEAVAAVQLLQGLRSVLQLRLQQQQEQQQQQERGDVDAVQR